VVSRLKERGEGQGFQQWFQGCHLVQRLQVSCRASEVSKFQPNNLLALLLFYLPNLEFVDFTPDDYYLFDSCIDMLKHVIGGTSQSLRIEEITIPHKMSSRHAVFTYVYLR
jgi:hypothetical protein